MSHPLHAAVLAILLAATTAAHADAFDLAPVRNTSFTDALVPPAADLPLAPAAGDGDCVDGPCPAPGAAALDATLAAADTRIAASAAPAMAPVRAGVDGKPAGIGSVPEPQTYALLCGGLGLLCLRARALSRRRQPE